MLTPLRVFIFSFALITASAGAYCSLQTPRSHSVIYVTNGRSGNLSEIDSSTLRVVSTIPLGKRPRGIHASPGHRFIYMTLSGWPLAGPGVDESKLPPPDKTADGIGVFEIGQNKLVRILQCGSDPENFDITKDGRTIIVSKEEGGSLAPKRRQIKHLDFALLLVQDQAVKTLS